MSRDDGPAVQAAAEPVDYQDVPPFPEGSPEYERYREELTAELRKFARGEEPYPYPPTD